MELRDIEYFAVIAEERNVRRASERLGLGPPALSKSLRRLEKSLRAKLVKRTPKGVELTAVGTALAAKVQRIRLTLADLTREAADLSDALAGHLRIGVGPALAEDLPAVYEKVAAEAPRLTLDISVTDNDVMLPALRRGELDLVLNVAAEAPLNGLTQETLFEDDFVVCAASRHPLSRRRAVSLAAASAERWILPPADVPVCAWLARRFQEAQLPTPIVAVATRSTRLRLQLVAVSRNLAFASRRAIRQAAAELDITELPVKELLWPRRVCVFHRDDGYAPPAARRMLEALKAMGLARSNA